MSSYSCAEKQMTLTSSCSYRGTHAWAATHVQKKWHSWAATHVQKKMTLMSNCSKKGVLMHMSSCSCAGKNGHEQLLMWGYSCMSSCSWVQHEFYHAWAKSKGRKSPSKGRKYPSKGRIYPVMIFGHHGSQKKRSNQKRTLAAKKSWVTTKIHEQPKTHQ